MNARTVKTALAVLLIAGAAVRVAALFALPNLESMEADSYSRLGLFLQWVESPLPYPDTNFGPLHMVLLWIPWKLTGSLVFANRIFSLLLSVGLLAATYFLVRRIAGEAEALASVATLAFSAQPILSGVVTAAEGPYAFFFMVSLAAFAALIEEKEKISWSLLILFAASASCVLALRFESWMFLPVWAAVLWKKRGIRVAAIASALLAIFPLVHMYVCYTTVGHPLWFLLQSQGITQINFASVPLFERATGWFRALLAVQGPVLFAVSFAGAAWCAARGRARLVVGFFLWHLLVFEAQALRGAMDPSLFRYATLLSVLSAPCAAVLISDLAGRAGDRFAFKAAAVAAAAAVSASSLFYLVRFKEETESMRETFEFAERMKSVVTRADRVFLGGESYSVIATESGLSWSNFRLPEYPDGVHPDIAKCRSVLSEWNPTMILTNKNDPTFPEALGISACAPAEVSGVRFAPVLEHGSWCLFARVGEKP